jgi:type II secretory pathway component PulK
MLAALSAEFSIKSIATKKISTMNRDDFQVGASLESGLRIAELILDADKTGKSSLILKKKTYPDTDSYFDLWAYDLPPFNLDGYSVKILIRDEHSKINVNAATTEFVEMPPCYHILNKFFNDMGFERDYTDCITDYIDSNDSRRQYGAETYDYYSRFPVQGKAKNAPLDSIQELLMVKGISWQIFRGIAGGNIGTEDYLIDSNYQIKTLNFDETDLNTDEKEENYIRPGREKSRNLDEYLRVCDYDQEYNKINVNTAPFRVLLALASDMTEDKAAAIIDLRKKEPIKNISQVASYISENNNLLTVSSVLFSIKITITRNDRSGHASGIYDRNLKKYLYLKFY